MTYRDRPVFTWSLDWSREVDGHSEFDLREVVAGFGTPGQFADQTQVIRGWSGQVWLDTLDQIEAFDAFTATAAGRLIGFWFPTPQAAFRILRAVSPIACDIEGEAFAAAFADRPATFVWFTRAGYTPRGARVVTATPNGDGTSRVTFEEAVTADPSWLAWDLTYVRFADDAHEAEVRSEQQELRRVQVIELPSEYAAVEIGERPVYLYRLWVGEGEDRVEWRWTSFAWDIEGVGPESETYIARRITHGAIRFDITGVSQGVTLDVDRELADSPFPVAFPPHGCQPLHVSIASADYADLSAPSVLFTGLVSSISVSGRLLRARCSTHWGQADVPAFLFGPRCLYRLFEPDTCRLDRTAHEQPVTLVSVSGRDVVVSGDGLPGRPVNHFAEGLLEAGAGLAREVRLVLTSSAVVGGALVLRLNAPLRFNAAGAPATLLPGCDGRWSTCDSKFANTPNFGGHRFALRNLALKAIEVATPSGGKK